MKCSFSRALGVEFVPSEIERNENTIKVAFKRKYSFTYGELRYAFLELDGLRVLATHGHRINKDNASLLRKGDVLLHGHTHVPTVESFGSENFYINCGSASIPKDPLGAAFLKSL